MIMVPENRVRLALIGAGSHSRGNHASAMAQYVREHPGQVELAAVCDLQRQKAEAFAEMFGFKAVYTDYLEMIEEERPDGCVCVMPIELTAALAIDLMKRGMPVTIEKPMGSSLKEIRRVAEIAEETGTPNMVSVNRRFDPLVLHAYEVGQDSRKVRHRRWNHVHMHLSYWALNSRYRQSTALRTLTPHTPSQSRVWDIPHRTAWAISSCLQGLIIRRGTLRVPQITPLY